MGKKQKILKVNVDVISINEVFSIIKKWINDGLNYGKFICLFNVHMCMEAFDDNNFLKVLEDADLVIADGFPIYIAQKMLGHSDACQIRGVDLTMKLTKFSAENNISIGFLGGTENTLKKTCDSLSKEYGQDVIKYSYSPPFRNLSNNEKNDIINNINLSRIKILFIGLGCPKQEKWMKEYQKEINCIMIGVGAAFDFIAGNKRMAPLWVQKIGFEWIHRFLSEPKRLWKRYLKHNPRFMYYFIQQYFSRIVRR